MAATLRSATCCFMILACCAAARAQVIVTPLLEYTLNSANSSTALPAGATVTNTGSAGTNGNLTMFGAQPGPPGQNQNNLYSADGGGVSGLAGDRALDNTSSTGMGNQAGYGGSNYGPGAAQTSATSVLPNQTALTFTGWIKTQDASTAWTGISQIFEGDGGNFMHINAGDPNLGASGELTLTLQTSVGGGGIFSSNTSHTGWAAQGTWMFVGLVWQGGSTGKLDFYNVDTSHNVQDVTTLTSFNLQGAITATSETSNGLTYGLALGDQGGARLRPFDGFLDDFRVFPSALSLSELQTIVNADLNNTAIPTTLLGDIDGNGSVDTTDYGILKSHWMQTIGGGVSVGDLNGDGIVNIADFALFKGYYNSFHGGSGSDLTPVPEPATLGILATVIPFGVFVLRRRAAHVRSARR